jgi:hypothetical protein
MTFFAALTAVVFGGMSKDTPREQVFYGLKVFAEFIAIGLILGWVLYFIP